MLSTTQTQTHLSTKQTHTSVTSWGWLHFQSVSQTIFNDDHASLSHSLSRTKPDTRGVLEKRQNIASTCTDKYLLLPACGSVDRGAQPTFFLYELLLKDGTNYDDMLRSPLLKLSSISPSMKLYERRITPLPLFSLFRVSVRFLTPDRRGVVDISLLNFLCVRMPSDHTSMMIPEVFNIAWALFIREIYYLLTEFRVPRQLAVCQPNRVYFVQ